MPLDPSIFLRGAEMQANNAARTQATIGNFFDKLAEAKKAKPLDLENAAQEWVYRKSSGLPTTPELDAKAKAYDVFQTSKNSVNPATGEVYPQNRSIFDAIGGIEPVPYQSPWTPPETPGINPTGGAMPPMVSPTANPRDLTDKNGLPVQFPMGNVNDAVPSLPPIGDNYNEVNGGVIRQGALPTLPAPSNPKQAQTSFEAATDIAKLSAVEDAKVRAGAAADERKVAKMENDTLPILQDMLAINEKTLDMPYAGTGIVQGGARMVNPEAATQMDLLKQNRLDLAAPLAKQLGVNPTDKDFQATLNRIFDENASKASRKAQIENLMKKIQRKQELSGRGFKTPQERAPQGNAVSFEEYFK